MEKCPCECHIVRQGLSEGSWVGYNEPCPEGRCCPDARLGFRAKGVDPA